MNKEIADDSVFHDLEQYAIERNNFCELFSLLMSNGISITELCLDGYESHHFKLWHDRYEEFYILHKPSGTLINWYKHLGRTNTCNKKLTISQYELFVQMLEKDIKE